MLIVSREMGSRPLGVILTARRAVFIWGETVVMVPLRMVPVEGGSATVIINIDLVHKESLPFLSSIVTVSLAHFMRNLGRGQHCCEGRALRFELSLKISAEEQVIMLT